MGKHSQRRAAPTGAARVSTPRRSVASFGMALAVAGTTLLTQGCGGGGLVYLTLEFPEAAETRLETTLQTAHFLPPGGRRASEATRLAVLPSQEPVLCP